MNFNCAGGVSFINADLGFGDRSSLRIAQGRIDALGADPFPGDAVIDLDTDRVLPGMVNAHDHLHLNSLPRLDYAGTFRNAGEWIADCNLRTRRDGVFAACLSVAREKRLLAGGMKNLLCGVTTVAHHDPLYPPLVGPRFPIRVLQQYGWSHSLCIDGEEAIRASHRRTPADWPWIIHAAEGTDLAAATELDRLEALGCLTPNTLIVHGVALDCSRQRRLEQAGAGLIWCPSSNQRLFGRTATIDRLAARGRVALGSDSRLTGARDLLEEMRVARSLCALDDQSLEDLVIGEPARLLRLAAHGRLTVGADADLIIIPARRRLWEITRADVRLVMIGGVVRYGDAVYADPLSTGASLQPIRVDGRSKLLDRSLAACLPVECPDSGVLLETRGKAA